MDIVRRNTRSGQTVGAFRTGTLLLGDSVLTNHHCQPRAGDLTPVKASILRITSPSTARARGASTSIRCPWRSTRASISLLARVAGNPTATDGPARLSGEAVPVNRSMLVIHPALGRPKAMSRFRCFAAKDQGEGSDLRHRCDTLGSSQGNTFVISRVATR